MVEGIGRVFSEKEEKLIQVNQELQEGLQNTAKVIDVQRKKISEANEAVSALKDKNVTLQSKITNFQTHIKELKNTVKKVIKVAATAIATTVLMGAVIIVGFLLK